MKQTIRLVVVLLFAVRAFGGNCDVKVNGVVIKSVNATDRNDCYKQTSFGSENCKVYAPYFKGGGNLLEQYFNKTDRVNSDTCPGPAVASCVKTVEVGGIHYPNKTCAETQASFLGSMASMYHFTSKCPKDAPLKYVFNVSCQDAPPGFSNGAVYKGTACCGNAPPIVISNLPMQGGNEKTPCPPLNVTYTRADAATVPYLGIMLPSLDKQCSLKGAGLQTATVTFTKCAKDPRGPGFGPNATANLTCSK